MDAGWVSSLPDLAVLMRRVDYFLLVIQDLCGWLCLALMLVHEHSGWIARGM
jgi:hypothetical protein